MKEFVETVYFVLADLSWKAKMTALVKNSSWKTEKKTGIEKGSSLTTGIEKNSSLTTGIEKNSSLKIAIGTGTGIADSGTGKLIKPSLTLVLQLF